MPGGDTRKTILSQGSAQTLGWLGLLWCFRKLLVFMPILQSPYLFRSVMKAVSCQNGAGLPSCSRDWALRFTLRSFELGRHVEGQQDKTHALAHVGQSSSWNLGRLWTTSLGWREGVARLRGLSPVART